MFSMAKHWRENRNDFATITLTNMEPLIITYPVVCADGFSMSVQASSHHYCSPREYLANGNYDSWEIGFPSHHDPVLLSYYNLDDVYGYIPTSIVEEIINRHNTLLLTYVGD